MNYSQYVFPFDPNRLQMFQQIAPFTPQYPGTRFCNQLNPCEAINLHFDASSNHNGYTIDKDYLLSKRDETIMHIEDFEPLVANGFTNKIGKGAYSEVILVRHKKTKVKYALKIIDKTKFNTPKQQENFKKEIDIHERLIHPNIIRLYGSIEDETTIYLVLEYAENGTLFEYSRNKGKLSEKEAIFFFIQAARAIDFLHKNNFIHRDLKPENLLLTHGYRQLKLADFGWASEASDSRKTFCGTMEYIAPEILNSSEYSKEVDVWALGILLYELLHGQSPFRGNNDNETSSNIVNGQIRFLPYINKEIINLILKLLDRNNNTRIIIKEIFEWPIIQEYFKEFNTKTQIIEQNKRDKIERLKQQYLRNSDSKITNSNKEVINLNLNNEVIPNPIRENIHIIINENSIPSTKSSNSPRKFIDLNPPNMRIINPTYNEKYTFISEHKFPENIQEKQLITRNSSPPRFNVNSQLQKIKTELIENVPRIDLSWNFVKQCLNFAGFILPN